jgi:hypothetical protein
MPNVETGPKFPHIRVKGHTPTPWEMNDIGEPEDNLRISQWERIDANKVDIAIIPVGYSEPFESVQQANAAFIVLACNNHEALVAALEFYASPSLDLISFDNDRGAVACAALAAVRNGSKT